jgi:spore germination protein KB
VLGPHIAANATFPLLKTVGKIDVGGFIQRMDSIAVATLIIGGFFKIALFFYAAVKGVADLLQVKKNAGIPLVLLIVAWVRARDIDFFQREKYRK